MRNILFILILISGFVSGQNSIYKMNAYISDWIIYKGDTLAVTAVAHAAAWDTLFVTKGSILDTVIVSRVHELDNLSDVVLTAPDASDMLILDDETMKWVNYPFSNLIGDINDSLPNYWYLDGDTIKTIYNVVVDSSFLMKYNGWYSGYMESGSVESIITSKIDGSDGIANIIFNDNGNYMWYVQTLNAGGTASGVVGIDTNGTVRTYMVAEIAGQTSSIQVYPTYTEIKSDSIIIDGNVKIEGDLTVTGYLKSGTGSIADNDSTPSVASYNTLIYAGSANPVSIDALDDHVVGCYYTIIGNSNTYTITVIDGTPAGGDSFNLAGGNWVGGSQDVLLLYCIAADAFVEVSRSNN